MESHPRAPRYRPTAALVAGAVIFVAYAATSARTVTRWDSGEFLAAVHSLGIPHPPGTPLYVLLARVWAMLLAPLPLTFATRVGLFSAICAAAAVTLLGVLVARWTPDRLAGAAATLCAGGTATLWLSATEAEVYAPALLVAMILLYVADTRSARAPLLLVYLAALAWTLHPAALVTLPAAVLLVIDRAGQQRPKARSALAVGACALVGISVVLFLIIRAQHDPAINQGNPSDIASLVSVLTREQYADAGLWPRQAPFWLQIGNWFEYADWQFALGLDPAPPPSLRRTAITIVFAALGIVGALAHRASDRRSWRALILVFAAASVGLTLYLNLKAGPSYGAGILPPGTPHEARERDYFFMASFIVWGAWAGIGAVALARRGARLFTAIHPRALAAIAIAISAMPLALNWRHADQERRIAGERIRGEALRMLAPVPARAVFIAIGDNDTYPLWYLQEVERVRRDVTVVTFPLLATRWYREELARRYDLLADPEAGGTFAALSDVCRRAARAGRPIMLTPLSEPRIFAADCPGILASTAPQS